MPEALIVGTGRRSARLLQFRVIAQGDFPGVVARIQIDGAQRTPGRMLLEPQALRSRQAKASQLFLLINRLSVFRLVFRTNGNNNTTDLM